MPPYGWVGVDATLGTHCTGQHVKIGVGRDYADVAVLRGTYQGGGAGELDVAVTCETLGGRRRDGAASRRRDRRTAGWWRSRTSARCAGSSAARC